MKALILIVCFAVSNFTFANPQAKISLNLMRCWDKTTNPKASCDNIPTGSLLLLISTAKNTYPKYTFKVDKTTIQAAKYSLSTENNQKKCNNSKNFCIYTTKSKASDKFACCLIDGATYSTDQKLPKYVTKNKELLPTIN